MLDTSKLRIAYIVAFGVLGVLARYFIGLAAVRSFSTQFPIGTLMINIAGSFAIGVVYALGVEKAAFSEDLRVGISVGFLGGFTTFSAYALESVRLWEQSEPLLSVLYLTASPALGFVAALGGLALTRALT